MFDHQQCAALRQTLPDFSLLQPIGPSAPAAAVVQNYLEFYGFYEILKASSVDFFIGYRTCRVAEQSGRVATFYWRPLQSRGVVFLVHGLFDHTGLFQPLVGHFLTQGYAVIMVDLPGHGISDGEPTAIDSFADYASVVDDTLAYFQSELGALPVFGVGQSTGAAVLMNIAFSCARSERPNPFERLVFLGPLVRPRKWSIGRLIFLTLGRFMPQVRRDFTVLSSHDGQFLNFLRHHDPLQARVLSMRWIGAMHQWVSGFDAQPLTRVPLLVIQGTQDHVVDWQYNVPLIQRHFTCAQVSYIEGAMHHLSNEAEPWRKTIYTGITQFLRQRVVGAPAAQ